jgi:cytoskeletal protein RodZ
VRYLRALEEERFEQLPAGAYRRTFLRGYANFLGLDADGFVDEYAARSSTSRSTSAAVKAMSSRCPCSRSRSICGS